MSANKPEPSDERPLPLAYKDPTTTRPFDWEEHDRKGCLVQLRLAAALAIFAAFAALTLLVIGYLHS